MGKVDFCTDISDGVYSELNRISKKSNLGCVIYTDLIPLLSSKLKRILKQNSYDKIFNLILAGGEDYQLCFQQKSMSKKLSKSKEFLKLVISKVGMV